MAEEDLLLTVGVLLASLVCGWYLFHAINDVLMSPAQGICATASECVAIAMGG